MLKNIDNFFKITELKIYNTENTKNLTLDLENMSSYS